MIRALFLPKKWYDIVLNPENLKGDWIGDLNTWLVYSKKDTIWNWIFKIRWCHFDVNDVT